MKILSNNLPHFTKPISKPIFLVVTLGFPLLYIVLQIMSSNITILFYQILCFGLPCFWFLKRAGLYNAFSKINFGVKMIAVFFGAVLLSLGMNFLSQYWESIFPLPHYLLQAYDSLFHVNMPFGFYFDVLQIALIPAIAEEMLFRGVVLTKLGQRLSPSFAIGIQALVFALYHLNPWQLPFLFILGLFFGWVYFKTNNLGLAMLAHFINNLMGVIWYYKTGHL